MIPPKSVEGKKDDDFFLKVDCEILTLSDVIGQGNKNRNGAKAGGPSLNFDSGVLYYYQVKDMSLQIPDRICQNVVQSWTPDKVETLEDFKVGLPEALKAPFNFEEQGWASCEDSSNTDPLVFFPEENTLKGAGASLKDIISQSLDEDYYQGGFVLGYVDEDDPTGGFGDPAETIRIGIRHFARTAFEIQVQNMVGIHFDRFRNGSGHGDED